jgi:hypothetical protein
MKNLALCFFMLTAKYLYAAELVIPEISECQNIHHPSGLNLENIKARAQLMFSDSNDLSIKVLTYVNLKKKISLIVKSSNTRLDDAEKLFVNNLMSRASSLKSEICTGFGISDSQLMLLDDIPALLDAPSLNDCLDSSSLCGLNLTLIAKRERILRCHGIADDPATYVVLMQKIKQKIENPTNSDQILPLTRTLHELVKKVAKSELGLNYKQIFAITGSTSLQTIDK